MPPPLVPGLIRTAVAETIAGTFVSTPLPGWMTASPAYKATVSRLPQPAAS